MRTLPISVFCAILLSAASGALAQEAPLELRFTSEQVRPGGVLQAKLENTEPKPISTGGGAFDLGSFDEFLGIAVNSPVGDAVAAAVIRGSTVRVSMTSPSGGLGLEPDYPIFTLTVRAPDTAPLGTQVSLTLAGDAEFLDANGIPYQVLFRPGTATLANVPSISNVSPGSGVVPAGGVVTVDGSGFEPGSELRIDEAAVTETRFVSSTRLEAVLGQAATMHGRRVEVRNRSTNARMTYFAYQRTTPLGASAHPVFSAVETAFAQRFYTDAILSFGGLAADAAGLALQNIGPTPASVTLELSSGGAVIAQSALALGSNTQLVRSLGELFAMPCVSACAVRVRATAPVQVLGLAADAPRDVARPVLPSAETQPRLSTSLNSANFRVGDTLALTWTFTPATAPRLGDAYVVLRVPGGAMMSLTPTGLVPGLVPYARGIGLSTPFTQPILSVVVPSGAQPGSYDWLSAVTQPDSLSLLTAIASTPFVVLP